MTRQSTIVILLVLELARCVMYGKTNTFGGPLLLDVM
jgi:hypothetical protein